MMALTYRLGLTESTWRTEPVYSAASQSVTLTRTSGDVTHISIVVLLVRPQDQHDKKEETTHNRQLQHSRHHPTAAAAAHRRHPTRGWSAWRHTDSQGCVGRVYLLMATIGRQQQQQQGKGSGETCCPARAANIRALPPKKSAIRPINLIKVME